MASADYTIVTPERVSLEYGIAGVGSRGGAVLVDTLLQAIVLLLVTLALAGATAAASSFVDSFSGGTGILVLGLWLFASLVISSGYFMVFEIVWNGQTPGKRLLGLRVIRESGYPIRPVDSVTRNLVRIVDWLPVGYGVGVLVMLLNPRARRLGDFAGGTLVVREGRQRTLSTLSTVASPAPSADDARGVMLSSADATLLRDFLVRRGGMDPSARADLARRLAAALSQRYQLPFNAVAADPERFLERLGS
ncbi:MAG TPA: RDD family protein [Chloroflexota bacterium]|jgi:uncharacterized RDD family membrane protein YckC